MLRDHALTTTGKESVKADSQLVRLMLFNPFMGKSVYASSHCPQSEQRLQASRCNDTLFAMPMPFSSTGKIPEPSYKTQGRGCSCSRTRGVGFHLYGRMYSSRSRLPDLLPKIGRKWRTVELTTNAVRQRSLTSAPTLRRMR